MKRKVIKQGHNTLTVTLPAEWVKQNNIEAGTSLELEADGNRVIISASPMQKKMSAKIDISEFDIALEKVVYSLYKKGYDEIELYSKNPKILSKIYRIVLELVIGFEVVGQSASRITIKSVAAMDVTEFDALLRRTWLLLHAMGEGILDCYMKGDRSLEPFRQMEATNNRYTGFCRRLLNKGYVHDKPSNLLYSEIDILEQTADEYKYMCDFLMAHNLRGIEQVYSCFHSACQLGREVERLHYKFSIPDYLQAYKRRKKLVSDLNTLMEKSPDMMVHLLLNIVQKYTEAANLLLTMSL